MELQDIFDQLTYGELANLSIGGSDSGGISLDNTPKIISHTNMAIQSLHTKFHLIEEELVIILIEGATEYEVDTNLITAVFNEKGERLGFNDVNDPNSIFMPKWDYIQVPETVDATELHLKYYPKPVKIALNAVVADTTVDLPEMLLEPLLAYIASRVYSSMGGIENIQEGLSYMSKYELLCLQLKNANILNNLSQNTNIKLEKRGWL